MKSLSNPDLYFFFFLVLEQAGTVYTMQSVDQAELYILRIRPCSDVTQSTYLVSVVVFGVSELELEQL